MASIDTGTEMSLAYVLNSRRVAQPAGIRDLQTYSGPHQVYHIVYVDSL